jgi:flagellar biosynthetic protein FlhB
VAENEDGAERSEDPTAKRRQSARDEGRIPKSQELTTAAVLLVGAASLSMAGGTALGDFAKRVLRESAGALSAGELTPGGAVVILRTITYGLLGALMPFAAATLAVGAFTNLVQTRGAMSLTPVTPKLTNLDPTKGLQRMFSPDSLVTLLKSILKLTALSLVTYTVIRGAWPELMSLADTGPGVISVVMRTLGYKLVLMTGLGFLILAGADFGWQMVRHEQSLKMTKQEVVMENKESEGDPQMKGRIRQMQRQRARQRMFQAVPSADVVITNPTHVAVALRYDPEVASAPIVVAMGERKLAERIKQLARESNVPMVENRPVARALLATCVIGKPIPPALYAAVAEILAFVYRQRAPRYLDGSNAVAA